MGIEALAIGAGLGLAGAQIGGSAMQASAQRDANLKNSQSIEETNRMNEALTRESWAREDNAVQRRRRDLLLAGINPNLAAGSAAATSGAAQMQAKHFQTEDAWGQGVAKLGSVGQSMIAADQALKQTKLTEAQARTEMERPAAQRAAASRDMALASKSYAEAGFKNQATRIMKKDADLWVDKGIDVRDRDAVSKVMKAFPNATQKVKEAGGQAVNEVTGKSRFGMPPIFSGGGKP